MNQTAPGIDASTLAMLFETNASVLARTVDGIDHETSLRRPETAGNCMNWVLAHLVGARNGALKLVGAEPAGDLERLARCARGSKPLTDAEEAIDWDELVETFEEQRKRLQASLGLVTADELARPLPEDENPFGVDSVGQMLGILHYHETYHTGQLGILRRIMGREGVIK